MTETKSRGVLPWLVAVAFFMQTLDSTILNTALSAMAVGLGESPLQYVAAWFVDGEFHFDWSK